MLLESVQIAARAAAYLRATPLPHLTAATSLAASFVMLLTALRLWEQEPGPLGALCGFLAAGCFNAVWISLADGYNRYREYKRFRDLLRRHGYRPIILRAGSGSRCQRDAAMAAAKETGYQNQAEAYYRNRGYRWYHLLPDGAAADPLFLLSPRFLKATLLPRSRQARRRAS